MTGAAASSWPSDGEWAFDPIGAALGRIRAEFVADDDGEVATYIPQLSTADPAAFGLALVGVAGSVYSAGEATVPFTIQSVSKPFVYALALADVGVDGVLERVGVEPSGEAFNAISLEPGTGRPSNPLINAGAILTTSLVHGGGPADRFERIRDLLSRCAGRRLEVDDAVFRSEHDTGDRNRALAYLMRHAGSLTMDAEDAVDAYFRQCSVLVTAVDLATMAATLANGGVNPRTDESVMDQAVAEQVLTVMATCGMYDFSGEWLFRVGLPAKSGVSGGIVAVSPSQFGIGLYSPRLDGRGNSVRGVAASEAISERFSLHLMHQVGRSAPVFERIVPDAGRVGATDADGTTVSVHGAPHAPDVAVLAMQGYLEFAAAEEALLALRTHAGDTDPPEALVIDLGHVTRCHPVAAALFDGMIGLITEQGVTVVTVDRLGRGLLVSAGEFPTRADGARLLPHRPRDSLTADPVSGTGVSRAARPGSGAIRIPARATRSSRSTSSSSRLQPSAPAFSYGLGAALRPRDRHRALGDHPVEGHLARVSFRRGPRRCAAVRPRRPSTVSIGWLEKFRLPGGGWAAEYLPVSRPWPIGE